MEYTRVTRALRKRLNSVDTERPITPQTDLDVIQENVYSTPARRTRRNSQEVATPILMPATTPGRRLTRRNSLVGEVASPAIISSPMRRSIRRLNSEDISDSTEITKLNKFITEPVAEEDESGNEMGNNTENRKRITRALSNSPQKAEENKKKTSVRGRQKKNTSQKDKSPVISSEHNDDSDDMILTKIKTLDKSNGSKSTNISREMDEKSTENSTIYNEQSINREKTKKIIDQSLQERQRMKSVTFNDSDSDNIVSPKKFPKTPITSKSKSFIDGTNLESSNENSENSFQHLSNSKNEKNISKQQNDSKSIDNSTIDIQNENSNSIINMKTLHIDTPYKELKLKNTAISSSTPINVKLDEELDPKFKKFKPVVRLSKNCNSLIEKSNNKENPNLVSTKFSVSWDHAIRGNNNQKIDNLYSDNIEESIKINEFKNLPKKAKQIIPSDEEEESCEKSEFIDDEAEEVDSEDTIDEEERKYLEEHEVPVQGESLGSEDTDNNSEDEDKNKEEEEENDSFVVSDQTDDNKFLSTDSEEELLENKNEKKTKYRRIQITDSDDETSPERRKGEIKVNDRSFTIEKDSSIISISTEGDDVCSSGKKIIINQSDKNISQQGKQNVSTARLKRMSLNKETQENSQINKSLNTSQISGVEIFSATEAEINETENTTEPFVKEHHILNKTDLKSPKSRNSSINISKTENCEHFIKNKNSPKSPHITIRNKENAREVKTTNTNSFNSPKSKNSLNDQSLFIADSDDDIHENEKFLNKSLKSPKNKNASFNKSLILLQNANSEGEDRNKIDENQNKSPLKSPKNMNSSINKKAHASEDSNDSEEEGEIVLKQVENTDESKHEKQIRNDSLLKSPKKLNNSQKELNNTFNQTNEQEMYGCKSNNSQTEENSEKFDSDNNVDEKEDDSFDVAHDKKQNDSSKSLEISENAEELIPINLIPKNKNSSINKKTNKDNKSGDSKVNEVAKYPYIKSPINSTEENRDNINENQLANKSLLKSPKILNDSRKSMNSSILNNSKKIANNSENVANDSDDEGNDKDYVPEIEQQNESSSSTNSEDAEELKIELEKIKKEKNIPKTNLSYSFTSVTEYRPSKIKKNFSTSFTTDRLKVSDDSSDSTITDIGIKESENVLSEAEELEKLNINDFKLKTSKRKSMIETNDKNLKKSSKKSRHSLESTYVDVDEELFEDLRQKLNKSNKIATSLSVENKKEEEQQNNLELNKSSKVSNKEKTTVTDGNFNHVTHILNRCDEILEAANKAKREAKLQNKINNNNKPKKVKINKKKFKENSDSSDSADQIKQIKNKSKEAAIVKAVKHWENLIQETNPQNKFEENSAGNDSEDKLKSKEAAIVKAVQHGDVLKQKKNTQKNLEQFTAKKSKLLPTEILAAIGKDLKEKEHFKDSQLKYQSESSEMSDIENRSKSANKIKHKAVAQPLKQKSKIITNPSGIFIEEPITPVKNKASRNGKNNRKIISEQELPSGIVYEECVTPESKKIINGFKECHVTPKAIGFKVRSILSAGQKEPPVLHLDKNSQNRKRKNIPEPTRSLPKPKWTSSGDFTVEKLEEKLDFDETILTDFYIMPLEQKKHSKLVKTQNFSGINNKALEFKKNAMINNKVHRETSKEMLQRKERQNVYNKF